MDHNYYSSLTFAFGLSAFPLSINQSRNIADDADSITVLSELFRCFRLRADGYLLYRVAQGAG